MKKDVERIWTVRFYGKRKSEYKLNHSINVIALTASDAIEKVLKEDSEAQIVGIQHQGTVDIH